MTETATNSTEDQNVSLVAQRIAPLAGVAPNEVKPKHVAFMGLYCLLAGIAFSAMNLYSWRSSGTVYPKVIFLAPVTLLLGGWLLVDAGARSKGRPDGIGGGRAPIWICIGIGAVIGSLLLHELTGDYL